jgi:Lrp/AsnC family transcriptional regulator
MGKDLPLELDSVDKKILEALQRDATLSVADIADLVGTSQSPCWRRIQRLRDSGVIIGQVTLLDRRLLGLNTQIFAQVKLNDQSREMQDAFSAHIRQLPEVLECFLMMGSMDFLLRVVTEDIDTYERFFFDKLSRFPGIKDINSMVAFSQIKSTTALPIR